MNNQIRSRQTPDAPKPMLCLESPWTQLLLFSPTSQLPSRHVSSLFLGSLPHLFSLCGCWGRPLGVLVGVSTHPWAWASCLCREGASFRVIKQEKDWL